MEFIAYQLKGVAYYWYNEWEVIRGEDVEHASWEEIFDAFIDQFITQKMRDS